MKLNKAYKFRIYPTKEQELLFNKTFGCCRFIWNKMLEDKIKFYEKEKKPLYTTPARYKSVFPFLEEVDSLALANIQLQLEQAYRNFFKNKAIGFPKWKSKKCSKNTYKTNHVHLDNKLILPKIGSVKIKLHRQIPNAHKIKAATICQEPSGKYFVSILCEYEHKQIEKELQTAVGLDFSMKELFVASDGSVGNYPRFFRCAQEELGKRQRQLSRKKKGSNNRKRFAVKVAKIHEKIRNQRSDFLHKLSYRITNDYDIVCVEDLNMKGLAQALNFGKSVSDNGWGIFTNQLAYKLFDRGGKLIKIDKYFPSTKTCSHCGNIKDISLAERTYACEKCGLVIDRDYNSAINIQREGIRILQGGSRPKRLLKKKGSNLSVRNKPNALAFGI